MAPTTSQQKKLQILQKQLYGGKIKVRNSELGTTLLDPQIQSDTPRSANIFSLDQVKITPLSKVTSSGLSEEGIYLKKDLFKILTLSSLILGFQFLIFYAMQVKLLPSWI